MLVGYARVSTQDQNPDMQLDALNRASYAMIGRNRFLFPSFCFLLPLR